ncbi:hypothetical protein [Pseudoalteromonas sp. 31A1]|uniref:hypothetical protein n=1 Tax=Pseudoalteromonas sp. 31A1 TaxID=2686351 RepID=UPI0013FDAF78|nr:hypothetical protein [Pseudoalteromonas sp. 31A1]
MKTILVFLCLALQAFIILSLISFFTGIYNAYIAFSGGDPKLIAGHISSGIVISLIQMIPALVGYFISYMLIKNKRVNDFALLKPALKFFAYLWLLFIPIGTVLGAKLLTKLNKG